MTLDAARFHQLWTRLTGRPGPDNLFASLAAAYAEPSRAYHNADHIVDCLSQFDAMRPTLERADEIELALWFHDAVYDSRHLDNEERSAELACAALQRAGATADVIERAERLILATKHKGPRRGLHAPPLSTHAQVVVDVDLSILGRRESEFDDYDRKIRSEYAWVAEEDYRAGRARFLAGLLSRPALYHTDHFRASYEDRARRNLERAIARLRQA